MKTPGTRQKLKVKRQKSKVQKALGSRLQALEGRRGSSLPQPPAPSLQSLILILPFVLCLLLSAPTRVCAQQNGSAAQKNPYTGNAAAIAEGQELYKKMNCYGCHGMQGGGGMGPSLIDEAWKTGDGSDLNLLDQILNGKGQMPPYKTMVSEEQAWKLIAFIRSLYKGDPTKISW